jgi:hypothetical protein
MKTIYELWDELRNHPDYITGSLWTIKDIAINYEYNVKDYLEDKLNIEEIDESDIEKYSLDVVKHNIEFFKNAIEGFEIHAFSCLWDITNDELNLPEFKVEEIV